MSFKQGVMEDIEALAMTVRQLLIEMWAAWVAGEDGDNVFARYGEQIKALLADGAERKGPRGKTPLN